MELLKKSLILVVLVIAAAGSIAYGFYTSQERNLLKGKVVLLEQALKDSNDSLTKVQADLSQLSTELLAEREKSTAYARQADEIGFTVDRLTKLAQTDPQLLQKYSKVYFLNENYNPIELTTIDNKYLNNKDKPLLIHDRVWPFLKEMLDAAQRDNLPLQVISAYRSFGTQALVKSGYKTTYGAGTANQFSADQGYSEHQLGTTIDVTTPTIGATFSGFQKSPTYTWLQNNAYKYGFVLSYPPNNSYYVFEPWHWRFVGLDLALRLHNENKNFYDLDQREINTYLINIFNGTAGVVQ
ncbi:M15 family metallopeptidase [Candidatus Parcubacteria bacterium]|nr:M15 family metallopeptidase [Candidatus Parcubacteria bacterium]